MCIRDRGGGAKGFGIGGADGGGLEKPSVRTAGDTTTKRDLGVDGTLLEAGVFKATRGDLLDGRDAEGALRDAGVSGSANDEGVPGRSIDAGVAGEFKSTTGDLLDAGVGGG